MLTLRAPLTGEPDAGNPPVRFGGRGEAHPSSLPLFFGRPCGTGTAHVASNPSNIGRDGCATEFSLRDILHSWNRFRRTGLIWSRGEAAQRFSLRHRWSRPRFVKRQNIGLMPLPMLVTVKT